ncbi:MAG TPA: D-TA family PLP-dependent enzyme [Chitinophagaceae bacterium]|nr:D-TA family PLP-dependent enzyme [Chitinophagaceae bacterium]
MADEINWYKINNVSRLDSPALVVYPERVKENIRLLKGMIKDPKLLRPHIKTNKSRDVAEMMIKKGVLKFKCATIAEAEMLGMCKAADVLLAYQPLGPKLARFIQVIQEYPSTTYSTLVDNTRAADEMSDALSKTKLRLNVFVDLNVGMNRTGITPDDKALQLYIHCSRLKRIKPIGLHAYDGHVRNPNINIRKTDCDQAFTLVESLREKIIASGLNEPVIVAGGSPTFPIHATRGTVECSPGTFIYWDKGYTEICPEQPFLPAALVITRVISLPDESKLCLDLGHKSISAENELSRRVYFLNAPQLKTVSQSEEHLVVEAGVGHSFNVGDVLYGMPNHICPTVALYERAYTVVKNKVKGEWKTIARDRKINL